jgi:hypothetical protein
MARQKGSASLLCERGASFCISHAGLPGVAPDSELQELFLMPVLIAEPVLIC